MLILGESLLSSAFTTFFYLIMVWAFASQPMLLGTIIALYELAPNVFGIAWGAIQLPLTSVRQIQIGWLLRAIGAILLLIPDPVSLKIIGIFLAAITPTIVFSIEKASFTVTDSSTSTMINKFVQISQIQLIIGLASPILAGYLISQHNNLLLLVIMITTTTLGLVLCQFFPVLTTTKEKSTTSTKRFWRLPENSMLLSLVLLMLLGNLILWGPQAIAIPTFFQLSHMSATDLGIVITCGKAGSLLGLQLLGKIRLSIRQMAPALAVSLAFYASGFLALGLLAPIQVLPWCIIVVLINACESAVSPFLNTLISFLAPNTQKRASTMSTVVSLGNLGEPVGAFIAGIATIHPATTLSLMGGLGIAISVIFAILLTKQTQTFPREESL
jgi:hypothetical protein